MRNLRIGAIAMTAVLLISGSGKSAPPPAQTTPTDAAQSPAAPAAATLAPLALAKEGGLVRVLGDPMVLHANIREQWAIHTCAYILQGEKHLYWSAEAYSDENKPHELLVGQYPLRPETPGAGSKVWRLRLDDPTEDTITVPQMIRTPDGHIHVFLCVNYKLPGRSMHLGTIRYYRTSTPGDITTLVDRSERIPITKPYDNFHTRMNVGVTQDGKRLALVILAISEDGTVPFNTPVIFFGSRETDDGRLGKDFVFQEPIKYAEPMDFFYPQVAATPDGIVIVGQYGHKVGASMRHTTRLVHVGWDGKQRFSADLPADESDGNYWCFDLHPLEPSDWSKLILYHNKYSHTSDEATGHEFWLYDVPTHELTLRRTIQASRGLMGYGKWTPISENVSALLNGVWGTGKNDIYTWVGDLLGEGDISGSVLAGAAAEDLGYARRAGLCIAHPLQGSVMTPGELIVASDLQHTGDGVKSHSFVAWRLGLGRDHRPD